MKRWKQDIKKMRKQKRILKYLGHKLSKDELGRFRKRHALDCGKTRCILCHYEKYSGMKRRDEQLSDLEMKEQIKDVS